MSKCTSVCRMLLLIILFAYSLDAAAVPFHFPLFCFNTLSSYNDKVLLARPFPSGSKIASRRPMVQNPRA